MVLHREPAPQGPLHDRSLQTVQPGVLRSDRVSLRQMRRAYRLSEQKDSVTETSDQL